MARALRRSRRRTSFVFDSDHRLVYQGAPDWITRTRANAAWLRGAIDAVLAGAQPGPSETPRGCSIKWRDLNGCGRPGVTRQAISAYRAPAGRRSEGAPCPGRGDVRRRLAGASWCPAGQEARDRRERTVADSDQGEPAGRGRPGRRPPSARSGAQRDEGVAAPLPPDVAGRPGRPRAGHGQFRPHLVQGGDLRCRSGGIAASRPATGPTAPLRLKRDVECGNSSARVSTSFVSSRGPFTEGWRPLHKASDPEQTLHGLGPGQRAFFLLQNREQATPHAHDSPHSRRHGTSASWRTSTPARRRRPSASSITPAGPTRWARSRGRRGRWTGWSRSRSAASRSRRPRPPLRVEGPPRQHHRHAGPRGLHGGGRASASACSTARRAVRLRRRRRAAVRDGLAPGRQVRRSADRLHQQDGSLGADFDRGVQTMIDRLGAVPIPIELPIGAEADFAGSSTWSSEGRHLQGRPRQGVGGDRHSRRAPGGRRGGAHQAVEAVAEYDDELMEDYLEEQGIEVDRLKRHRKATLDFTVASAGAHAASSAVPASRTRAYSRCSTPSSTTSRAADGRRRSRAWSRPRRARRRSTRPAQPEGRRTVLGARLQGHVRPVRRQADLLPRVLGQARGGCALNVSTGRTERAGRILMMHVNDREEQPRSSRARSPLLFGLKQTLTGDTSARRRPDQARRPSCSPSRS